MTYPTVAVNTTNVDAGTDSPATARSDILDAIQKLNQMIAHTTAFAATLLDDVDAATARATLGAAASGANTDITSLNTGVNVNSGSGESQLHMTFSGQAKATYFFKNAPNGLGVWNATDSNYLWRADYAGNFYATSFNGSGSGLSGTATSLNAGLGAGQSWQNLTGSRTISTTYTNSTGRSIQVCASCYAASGANLYTAFEVAGVVVSEFQFENSTANASIASHSVVVPNGATYRMTTSGSGGYNKWFELR